MASFKKCKHVDGSTYYKVQVTASGGKKVTRSWKPDPGWSVRTIDRELKRFAADLENQLADGELLTRKEQLEQRRQEELAQAKIRTVAQYADGVFMPAKEVTFTHNSYTNYRQFLDRHILPAIGDHPIGDVEPAMITRLLLSYQKKGYAHASCIKLNNVLNGIFDMAFMDDTIPVNPMLKVKRPTARKGETAKEESDKAYTADEMSRILSAVDEQPLKWKAFIWLLIDTGIRRGEACGLQWRDIDWQTGAITIRHNLQYTKEAGIYLDTPKNGKTRTVDLGSEVITLLRQLRLEQASHCISEYVFTQDNKPDPMHPQSPTRYFTKIGAQYGIKDFHPHKLRHSAASIAITNGADIVSVSQRLGHSDTAVTLRMYAHANEESIRRAGDIARNALKKAK